MADGSEVGRDCDEMLQVLPSDDQPNLCELKWRKISTGDFWFIIN